MGEVGAAARGASVRNCGGELWIGAGETSAPLAPGDAAGEKEPTCASPAPVMPSSGACDALCASIADPPPATLKPPTGDDAAPAPVAELAPGVGPLSSAAR